MILPGLSLISLLGRWGYSEFHAAELWDQLYRQLADRLDLVILQRTDLHTFLLQNATLSRPQLVFQAQSKDGLATKYLFSLIDDETVESVLMRYAGRATACISTQVGCAYGLCLLRHGPDGVCSSSPAW